MNSPITSNEIETVIKKLTTNKSPGEVYQTFREELIPNLLKLFQTTAEEGTLPHTFYEASITLIAKPEKDIYKKKKEYYRPVSHTFLHHDEHRCKNPQQNTSKTNPTAH